MIYDTCMIYLSTAIGLTYGGSSTVHIYLHTYNTLNNTNTKNTQNNTNNNGTTQITTNLEEYCTYDKSFCTVSQFSQNIVVLQAFFSLRLHHI